MRKLNLVGDFVSIETQYSFSAYDEAQTARDAALCTTRS